MKNKKKLVLTRKLTAYLLTTMNEIEPTAYAAHEKVRVMWYSLTPKRRFACLYAASQAIAQKWAGKLMQKN